MGCLMVLVWTKKINILPHIIAFYRENDLKLKFGRGKKVDILTKEANAKNGIKAKKNVGLKKAYFWGRHVIQSVEAEMLGPFYIFFSFYKILRP